MAEEIKKIGFTPEELALVIDGLYALKIHREKQGSFVEGARCEILTQRIYNGFKRDSQYNRDLLKKAHEKQALQKIIKKL